MDTTILSNDHVDDEQKGKIRITKADFANTTDEFKKLASDKDVIHRKIQLWTNRQENEFAIRLLLDRDPELEIKEEEGRREFIATTNPKEQYTHPIAETDKLDLLQNGWDYALRDFVDNYKKEYAEKMRSMASESTLHGKSSSTASFGNLMQDKKGNRNDDDYPIKFIFPHRCTYCHAKFKDEEERKKHELKWHV